MKITSTLFAVVCVSMSVMADQFVGFWTTVDDETKKGRVYSCEMWRKDENLIVRGKIAFLGRNQTWVPYEAPDLPNEAKSPIPKIPVR